MTFDTDKKYTLIYADPPWTYRDKASAGKRGACHKYEVMTIEDICSLPVADIAADDCLLAMWHVPPMPMEALKVVEAWGFKFKTMKGFTWNKTTKNGLDHFGMGNYTRANSEDCLFAIKGKPKRVSASVRQMIHAQRMEHSRKPMVARSRLVELMGDVPRIELFARQQFFGWDSWGFETKKFENVLKTGFDRRQAPRFDQIRSHDG
jgi:N6-adenosine-specific RNA methylase IME4